MAGICYEHQHIALSRDGEAPAEFRKWLNKMMLRVVPLTCPRCRVEFEPSASFLMLATGGNVYTCICPACDFNLIGVEKDDAIDWNMSSGVTEVAQSSFEVTVTKASEHGTRLPIGGWLVVRDDSREYLAYLTAKIRTLKIPTLQVGDKLLVREMTGGLNTCSIEMDGAPVVWVPASRLRGTC